MNSKTLLLTVLLPLIISYSILHLLARPPSTLRPNKIFILGLSKTGTTSIGDALALLGYKRLGWKDIRSRHLVQTFMRNDRSALLQQTQYFDAFEDLPWPCMYREVAARFPTAKFVLSLRSGEEVWLRSMKRHVGRGKWEGYKFFYGVPGIESAKDERVVRERYARHVREVRDFFLMELPGGKERYAEVVIDDEGEKNWEVLCGVLGDNGGCEKGMVPVMEFPRSNTQEHWKLSAAVDWAHGFWSWSVTSIEEWSARVYYAEGTSAVVKLALRGAWALVDVTEQACSETYYKVTRATAEPLRWKKIGILNQQRCTICAGEQPDEVYYKWHK